VKTRHVYLIALWISGSFAVFSGGTLPYTFFVTLLLIRFILALTLKQNAKNLFILYYTRNVVLTAGDAIDVEYKATNTGIMPIAHAKITFQFSEKIDAVTPLKELAFFKSYQMINFSKKLNCLYHGYYRVGRVAVTLYDPLLLSSRTLQFDKDVSITVHPKVYALSHFNVDSTALMGTLSSRRYDMVDRASIANIRAYVRGDAQKDIHWKISAKRDQLFTRQYEQALRQKCVIIVDGYHGYAALGVTPNDEEQMVSFVASLSHQMMAREIYTRLYLNSQCIEGNNATHFESFLEALTGFSMSDELRCEDRIRAAIAEDGVQQQYFIVTPFLRQSTLSQLISLKQMGVAVTLFLKAKGDKVTESLLADARQRAVDVVCIADGKVM
jgi:uncharacterized protein (DUF58 family)